MPIGRREPRRIAAPDGGDDVSLRGTRQTGGARPHQVNQSINAFEHLDLRRVRKDPLYGHAASAPSHLPAPEPSHPRTFAPRRFYSGAIKYFSWHFVQASYSSLPVVSISSTFLAP